MTRCRIVIATSPPLHHHPLDCKHPSTSLNGLIMCCDVADPYHSSGLLHREDRSDTQLELPTCIDCETPPSQLSPSHEWELLYFTHPSNSRSPGRLPGSTTAMTFDEEP